MFEDLNNSPHESNVPEHSKQQYLAGEMLTEGATKTLEQLILECVITTAASSQYYEGVNLDSELIPEEMRKCLEVNSWYKELSGEILLKHVENLIADLSIENDKNKASILFKKCADDYKKFVEDVSTISINDIASLDDGQLASYYNQYLELSKNIHVLLDTLEKAISGANISYFDIEEGNDIYSKFLMIKHNINLFFSNENECLSTNISTTTASIFKDDDTRFSREYNTKLSSHFIYAMVLSIMQDKSDFFNQILADYIGRSSIEKFASIMTDEDFSDTVFAHAFFIDPKVSVAYDGYNVCVNIPIPDALVGSVEKRIDDFIERLSPKKKLLREVKGDLSVDLDHDSESICVKLSCPKSENSNFESEELFNEENMEVDSLGPLPFCAFDKRVLTTVEREYYKSNISGEDLDEELDEENTKLNLELNIDCLKTEVGRKGVADIISLLPFVDSSNSLQKLSISQDESCGVFAVFTYEQRWIDRDAICVELAEEDNCFEGSLENKGSYLIISSQAISDRNKTKLSELILLYECEFLYLLDSEENVYFQLGEIARISAVTQKIIDSDISLGYVCHTPGLESDAKVSLEIHDIENYSLVATAPYNREKKKMLCTRFITPMQLERVLTALDEIFSENNLTTQDPPSLSDALVEGFSKRSIVLSDSFRSLVDLILRYVSDPKNVKIFIENSTIVASEKDDVLTLDVR